MTSRAKDVDVYEVDGGVAVLVSHGFGAGWSTWNCKELAYDKRVVEFWLEHKGDAEYISNVRRIQTRDGMEARKFFKELGYGAVYFGGFGGIEMEIVPKGVPFVIEEYDGAEHIEFLKEMPFIVF